MISIHFTGNLDPNNSDDIGMLFDILNVKKKKIIDSFSYSSNKYLLSEDHVLHDRISRRISMWRLHSNGEREGLINTKYKNIK